MNFQREIFIYEVKLVFEEKFGLLKKFFD